MKHTKIIAIIILVQVVSMLIGYYYEGIPVAGFAESMHLSVFSIILAPFIIVALFPMLIFQVNGERVIDSTIISLFLMLLLNSFVWYAIILSIAKIRNISQKKSAVIKN
jgi:hypothetical protein